ncbi:MAG: DUF3179 domain-containing protein [Bacteroidetes bacterium]|nr:DUF3179 domain-containing protein [Bacteroidota bacterium]
MKRISSQVIILFLICVPFFSLKAQLKNPRGITYQWKTDTLNKTIDLSEITVAVPRKTFPAIDYPNFINKTEGLTAFFKHEPVISVFIKGEAKAYPLNMLTMHEISNDSLGGIPILPTYCPLCNSSMVYDRRLTHKGKDYLLEFEISGMLRNSDMVMADKQTETWWQQLIGDGLVGELAGANLTIIPSMVISVQDFFKRYPNGKILSPKTGTNSQSMYGKNPYVNYDSKDNLPYNRYFNLEKLEERLLPMERIIDIEGTNGYRIYPFSVITNKGVINDVYDDRHIVIFYKEDTVSVLDNKEISKSKAIGSATVFSSVLDGKLLTFKKKNDVFLDKETKSIWDITGQCIDGKLKDKVLTPIPHSNHFAFAWLTFHPESEIYKD